MKLQQWVPYLMIAIISCPTCIPPHLPKHTHTHFSSINNSDFVHLSRSGRVISRRLSLPPVPEVEWKCSKLFILVSLHSPWFYLGMGMTQNQFYSIAHESKSVAMLLALNFLTLNKGIRQGQFFCPPLDFVTVYHTWN